jgi:hypothetical protein
MHDFFFLFHFSSPGCPLFLHLVSLYLWLLLGSGIFCIQSIIPCILSDFASIYTNLEINNLSEGNSIISKHHNGSFLCELS